ncbi:MAG TPA: EutN/CcmL family microcompartment protein [bacterium]|nr:EutN/CcmL family microcompartment protein [bacterium]HOL48858.1 EutN/CcmL family microcompartment protein [bacterium]HPQ19685.1 EutN/CcmL family microcompartment protein [bacterium]
MIIAEVVGNVVATQKFHLLDGKKLLLVQPITLDGKPSGSPKVAVDSVGAGTGEIVFVVEGSSARMAVQPENKVPVDTAIIAIIDTIEKDGQIIFRKNPEKIDK